MSDLSTQIAVLETQMKNISEKVDEGFKQNSIEHKEVVRMFEEAMKLKADAKDVDKLESNQNKVIWAILFAVIASIMGFILK